MYSCKLKTKTKTKPRGKSLRFFIISNLLIFLKSLKPRGVQGRKVAHEKNESSMDSDHCSFGLNFDL